MAKGGRIKGKKNLKKVGYGSVENQFGVRFTKSEKKKLESLVNSANRKRKRMLSQEGDLVRFFGGENQGDTIGDSLQKMGHESDFILRKKTKSLQRFRTKEEYKRYIKYLNKVTKRNYIDKRIQEYRDNHIKAILNELGDKQLARRIKKMDLKDYMRLAQSDEAFNISYAYDHATRQHKINQINSAIDRVEGFNDKASR